MEAYLLWPHVRRYVKQASPAAHVALTGAAVAAAAGLLAPLAASASAAFVAAAAALAFAAPACLVRMHKFKAQINGPWDEAAPRLGSLVREGLDSAQMRG